MDFSHDWKNLWPVASVFRAPRLISDPAAASLGPLFFRPSPDEPSPTTLLTSPELAPELPPPPAHPPALRNFCYHSLIPSLLGASIAAESVSKDCSTVSAPCNSLCVLRRTNGDYALFILVGENSDSIGYVGLSYVDQKLQLNQCDSDNGFCRLPFRLYHRITKFAVSSADNCSFFVGDTLIEGFLLACTRYSVHWFGIGSQMAGNSLGELDLIYLGVVNFRSCVVHACMSPHLHEESAVLLDTGEIILFDLSSCFAAMKLPKRLRGNKIKINNELEVLGLDEVGNNWLSCEFGWHPRILIVAHSDVILLLDLRGKESRMNVLAKIDVFDSVGIHSGEAEHFVAFCMAGFDAFYFSVATEHRLLLFDTRQPLLPILQWDHWLDSPNYINMLRMSELRPLSRDGEYNWASESGYVIFVGSVWNCQFSLFCYGPSPDAESSIASVFSKFSSPYYAWGLPSGLPFSGDDCQCGDCLFKEDLRKPTLSALIDWQKRKDAVLGFCVLVDAVLRNACDTSNLDGFTVIKLKLSGKLESQRYQPCSQLPVVKSSCSGGGLTYYPDPFLCHSGQVDIFGIRNRFRVLDHLLSYLSGSFANNALLRMQPKRNPNLSHSSRGLLCELSAFVDNLIGSDLRILDILKELSFPANTHEIALTRMWTGLPCELLELAFTKVQNLVGSQRRRAEFVKFLDISSFYLGQLPPFLLRRPFRIFKRSRKALLNNDVFVGPVLPHPLLHAFHFIDSNRNCSLTVAGVSGFIHEKKIENVCDDVIKDVEDLVSDNLHNSVSLSEEDDKWVDEKPIFTFESGLNFNTKIAKGKDSQLHQEHDSCLKDGKFEMLVCRKRKASVFESGNAINGLELFDDLCPLQLNFDCPAMSLAPEELKFYKCLKRQFSKWQGGFKPYVDFCSSIK